LDENVGMRVNRICQRNPISDDLAVDVQCDPRSNATLIVKYESAG
jgi:hypothetical protein